MKLNQYFDHTLLKPEATTEQVQRLCEEAKEYLAKHVGMTEAVIMRSGIESSKRLPLPQDKET